MNIDFVSGSFRDPSGFLYRLNEVLYRQINRCYSAEYDLLSNGIFASLIDAGLLIGHEEVDISLAATEAAYKVIRPTMVPMISYPYEWSFSQLKDAALLTLDIQRQLLENGCSLKDASAYNVQFVDGRPIFIDTLSFERYTEGEPWVAYRQFCQHFLAPLALMCHTDVRLNQLLRVYIDGVPLDLASRLLPGATKWRFGLGMHIHFHAWTQKKYAGDSAAKARNTRTLSRKALLNFLSNLYSTVKKLCWKPGGTEWHDYYEANNNYESGSLQEKELLVSRFLETSRPRRVWDLGANTGRFSRVAASHGAQVVAWDIDPACVENNYLVSREKQEKQILPLLLDLTSPSPAIGWANRERMSMVGRGPVDTVLALGLVHHLAISNNVPLSRISEFLHGLTEWLIIEFVPKEDSQVEKLLATREDVFPHYNREGFERAFSQEFAVVESADIPHTARTLFLMRRCKPEVLPT